jgi:hypothetical protein
MNLTDDERPHFDRWLAALADGDPRLLTLLEATLGRIAASTLRRTLARRGGGSSMKMGDLPDSKPLPGEAGLLVSWLRDAIERDADWLRDLDDNGVPVRLAACESYEDMHEQARQDFDERRWTLPR